MFKITQNTIHDFTLAEILLMAAMNEIEAKRKASATGSIPKGSARKLAMIVDEEQENGAQGMSLEIVWRNPLPHVRASLRSERQTIPTADGQNKPARFARGGPIGTPIISGSHEQC